MSELLTASNRAEVRSFVEDHWQGPIVCIRDEVYRPFEHEGFLVRREGELIGLVTFVHRDESVLMLTQNSTEKGAGIGSSLLLRVIDVARQRTARRVWLTTSNANLQALGFYQRMGFRMVAVYPGAWDRARLEHKQSLPEFAPNGLQIRDEVEMELALI